MTQRLHLDTHVVVWLYAGMHDRFPPSLRQRLTSDPLGYSPMVRLELAYLHEIGKVSDGPGQILSELTASIGLTEDAQSFSRVIDLAGRATFSPDPFDRIIVSQALAAGELLATKDRRIRDAYPAETVWD